MVKIISSKPSVQVLKNIYDVCNEIFEDEKLFYSKEEVKELKQNKDNIFIK